jgi:tetratricopeptide (TPR) repeat protein
MDSRISLSFISFLLALSCAGCVNTGSKTVSPIGPNSTNVGKIDEVLPQRVKKEDGPKRNPLPQTEIAFGEMKEIDAESESARKNPEAQAKLRDDARQAYQKALQVDPNNLEAFRHLGRLYAKNGDYDRAFDTYKKAMAKHPKDGVLWYDLGMCHQRRKEFPESVRCLTKALELDPENREYQKKLGFTLAWMGQIDQGLAHLTRAQGAALAHYGIARVLLQRDQVEPARHHLRIALRENGNLEAARELLTSLESPVASNGQRDPRMARNE